MPRVTLEPRSVSKPLMVIESFTSDALAMFEIVLLEPSIVLLVSV